MKAVLLDGMLITRLSCSLQQRSHTISWCWQYVLWVTRSFYLTQFYLIPCKTVCVRATSVLRLVSCGGHFESGLAVLSFGLCG